MTWKISSKPFFPNYIIMLYAICIKTTSFFQNANILKRTYIPKQSMSTTLSSFFLYFFLFLTHVSVFSESFRNRLQDADEQKIAPKKANRSLLPHILQVYKNVHGTSSKRATLLHRHVLHSVVHWRLVSIHLSRSPVWKGLGTLSLFFWQDIMFSPQLHISLQSNYEHKYLHKHVISHQRNHRKVQPRPGMFGRWQQG